MSTIDVATYDNANLLRLWAEVMRTLQDREVIRSSNNPVGDLCEGLVAARFRVKTEPQSTRGYDVKARGVRYQVKGRRTTARSRPSHYSAIRDIDAQEFDFLIAVHLTEDFEVADAWKVSWQAVKRLARPAARLNAVRMPLIRGSLVKEHGITPFELPPLA
jgi:hypothetical protein